MKVQTSLALAVARSPTMPSTRPSPPWCRRWERCTRATTRSSACRTTTGDTLCAEHAPVALAGIRFPEPVMFMAVEPKTRADRDPWFRPDEIEVVVLGINKDKQEISLGIKQIIPDPWDRIPGDFPVGKVVDVQVKKVVDFGAFVDIGVHQDGLVHISELALERIPDIRDVLTEGDELKVRIIDIDANDVVRPRRQQFQQSTLAATDIEKITQRPGDGQFNQRTMQ